MPFSAPVSRRRSGMTLRGMGATYPALSANARLDLLASDLGALYYRLLSDGWNAVTAQQFVDSANPGVSGAGAFNFIETALGMAPGTLNKSEWMAGVLATAPDTEAPVTVYTGPANNVPAGPNASLVATAIITNVSRPGQALQVGDQYLTTIQGAPNQPVTMLGLLNAVVVHPATTQVGVTDSNGQLLVQGTLVTSNIGVHLQTWYVGTVAAMPITFTVSAASSTPTGGGATTPPPQPPAATYHPTVSLSNTSRPGQGFQVGDSFLLTITGGPPNSPVTVTALQNGAGGVSTAMGSTDANGNYSTNGTMAPAQIGAWMETWAVAGSPLNPLAFSVVAAPSASSGNTGSGYTAPASGSATPGATPSTANPAATTTDNWFTDSTFGLPNWMFAAGGGLLLVLAFSGGRR